MCLLPTQLMAQSPLSMAAKLNAAPATPASSGDSPDRIAPDELRKRQQELATETAANETAKVPEGITDAERTRRLRTLKFIGFNYRSHLNALAELDEVRRLGEKDQQERAEWPGFAEQPPYSIMMVDRLNSELQRRTVAQQTAEARTRIIAARLQPARDALKKTREAVRANQERAERAGVISSAAESWRLAQARLEERSASAYLSALLAARDLAQVQQEEAVQATQFAARQLRLAQKSVAFSDADLTALQARIDERQSATLASLDKGNSELEAGNKEAAEAEKRLTAARTLVNALQRELAQVRASLQGSEAEADRARSSAGFLQKINPFSGTASRNEIKKLQQQSAAREGKLRLAQEDATRLEREATLASTRQRNIAIMIDLDNSRLALLEVERAFWEMRYAARDGQPDSAGKRRTLTERSRELLDILAPQATQLRSELDTTLDQIMAQQEALANPADARAAAFHTRMLALLTARERAYRQRVSEGQDLHQMLQRVLTEYASTMSEMSPVQRLDHGLDVARNTARVVWNFELFNVEDTIEVDGQKITGSRGITVGKILQGILLVVVGYAVTSVLTRFLLGLATRRLKIDPMEAQIAHKWIMTIATAVLALMAMELLKIPLAAFAFLGGAIAIGVGFGMQTLLKNLISGLMLLLERPFKIRDVVEVGGIRGEITGINIRSCTIRSVTGIETLVPNSTFLEQNVTNWTLSNQTVRYTVSVGVAYGAPVDEVARLLREIADEHEAVVHNPAPEVIFEDFGDNALMFSLNVWLVIGQNQIPSRVVLSELRFAINRRFAEHGIGIPYPQRDVHLDTSAPLSVRMVSDPTPT